MNWKRTYSFSFSFSFSYRALNLLAPCLCLCLSLALSINVASSLSVPVIPVPLVVDLPIDRSTTATTTATATTTKTIIKHDAFQKLVSAAYRSERPLFLRGRSVDLGSNELKMDINSEQVIIIGPGSIRGNGHTLFTTGGNRHNLTLKHIHLHHCRSLDRGDEKRHQGAAIWARAKSTIQLNNCTVTSESGFTLWLVQRAKARLAHCTMGPCGRSAIVVFNRAQLHFQQGTIRDCVVHGVCSRGDSVVTLSNAVVRDCGARGCYAYHNATLNLSNTTVSGTLQVDASAVQVEALRPCDQVHVRIRKCNLQGMGNRGFGLGVAGNVDCDIDDSVQVDCTLSAEQQLSSHKSQLLRQY